jgi:hypothetical protein
MPKLSTKKSESEPKIRDLETITKELDEVYGTNKESGEKLKAHRIEFFDALDLKILERPLASQTIMVPWEALGYHDDGETVEVSDSEIRAGLISYIAKYHPLWQFETSSERPGGWEVFVLENPRYIAEPYVNPKTGRVFTRTVSQGSPSVDLDTMKAQDPELYNRVTEEVISRVMREADALEADDFEAVQEYLVPAKPTVSLRPPRDAKDDELEETN